MGTRNLTLVKLKGETKVAQYGQWDGYPTGQGQDIADFLKKANISKFKKMVKALKVVDEKAVKRFLKKIGCESGWMDSKQAELLHAQFPALDRDHGAGILKLIYEGKVTEVQLSEDFKKDTLFCEYCYEIDLDKETVSVNDGKKYSFAQWTRKGLMEKLEKAESEDEE